MKICNECDAENPPDSVYCSNCGVRADWRFRCSTCGFDSPSDAAFCSTCGGTLSPMEKSVAESPPLKLMVPTSPSAEATPRESGQPRPTLPKKRRNTALGALLVIGLVVALILVVLHLSEPSGNSVVPPRHHVTTITANANLASCTTTLTTWLAWWEPQFLTGGYTALQTLQSAGLLYGASPGVGGIMGEWLRQNAASYATNGFSGPSSYPLSSISAKAECQSLISKGYVVTGFSAPPD